MLGMESRAKYAAFLAELNEVPVFVEPWYLNAVCQKGTWGVVLAENRGKVDAALPYYQSRPDVITMPPLTQVMGPIIRPIEQKYAAQLSREKRLMGELIDQLPKVRFFRQSFSPNVLNWLPFYWRGYQQTTRYTYRFDQLSDVDGLAAGMASKLRGSLRKSEKQGVRVISRDDIAGFNKIVGMTFARQGMRNPLNPEMTERLYLAAKRKGAGELFFAVDDQGRDHAAAFLVWNKWCSYNLAGGSDPQLRASGAHSFVQWALVKAARERSQTFDFEGSMVEGIESAFRAFGARQVPYFSVWKDDRGWSTLLRKRLIARLVAARRRLLPRNSRTR